ncbi:MAG: zinc-ribbon domain-containing protein [Pseudomonadota bacterium]
MRLICPNCSAQYEVPDEVIPENGRDVQCSNCGDTWFQLHPDHPDYTPAYDPDTPEDDAYQDATDDMVEPEVEPEPEPQEEPYEDDDPAPAPPRRDLPEDVTSVLREEAGREARAREADTAGGLETQPDLGLSGSDDADRRTQQAKDRMARLRGFDDAHEEPVSDLVQKPNPEADTGPDETEIDLGTRANLLPDVGDVDQKLEEQSDGASEKAAARDGSRVATQKEGRSGFSRGLRLSVVLFVIAAALYVFAPNIVAMVPALQEPLTEYTQVIDQGRAALQGLIGQ